MLSARKQVQRSKKVAWQRMLIRAQDIRSAILYRIQKIKRSQELVDTDFANEVKVGNQTD